jgi:hypothetical protein
MSFVNVTRGANLTHYDKEIKLPQYPSKMHVSRAVLVHKTLQQLVSVSVAQSSHAKAADKASEGASF